MRALAIAWKDVRHTYRSFAGLAMMIIAPLLLAGAIGAAFGGGGGFSVPITKTVVVDLDGGAAGGALVSALTSERLADLLAVTKTTDAAAARASVDTGEAEVAVIVPAGLTAALSAASPAPVDVEIYKDPTSTLGPAIAGSVVQDLVQSLNGARAAASAAAQLAAMQGITDSARLTALAAKTAQAFSADAQKGGTYAVGSRAPVTPGGSGSTKPNTAGQILVGMMLFFTLFGAATPARSIIDEQREGTLSRLFTTSTPRSVVLGGKYISVFLVVLLQTVILLVAGRLLFGAHWGSIGPVIVLVLAGALVAASLGLLTVSYAKTPAQAGGGSAGIFVFLGLISGSFTGTASIGGAYDVVRHISPLGWLIDGWNHTMFGGSWGGIVVPVLAALAFAVVFFGVATFFFRRRFA